jgi:hypothetical protein
LATNISWWDRLIDSLSGGAAALPPRPTPPGVDQEAWAKNVERARISPQLTVHELGLVVFNETQSYSDRPDSNEPFGAARQKFAYTVLNADERWGPDRMTWAKTARPIEPSENALRNPAVRAAYESSMRAAREAFLSDVDPTNGAVFSVQRPTADRSNYRFSGRGARPQGVPLSTQSGPYDNSYTGGQVSSRVAWIDTYWDR